MQPHSLDIRCPETDTGKIPDAAAPGSASAARTLEVSYVAKNAGSSAPACHGRARCSSRIRPSLGSSRPSATCAAAAAAEGRFRQRKAAAAFPLREGDEAVRFLYLSFCYSHS